MDDSSNCSSTPRQATTPPPSTSSTTRNSLAWLAAGAPVDFTREVNQQTTTDQSAEERNSHASSETGETGAISQGHKDSVGTNFEVNESSLKAPPRKLRKQRPPKRKAVTYPSSALPVQREPLQSTSAVAVPPSDIETCTHSAAAIHPILANAIITKSNPRGPRKRNWCAALRKQLWW